MKPYRDPWPTANRLVLFAAVLVALIIYAQGRTVEAFFILHVVVALRLLTWNDAA